MKLLFLSLLLFTTASCMDIDDTCVDDTCVDLESATDNMFLFRQYYDEDEKTLNLRNLSLGDNGLIAKYKNLKRFINLVGVQNLILEKNNLTKIPYYLITFSLVNKSLRYVSLKYNRFNITLGDTDVGESDTFLPIDIMDASVMDNIKFKSLPKEIRTIIKKHVKRSRSDSISSASMISSLASILWDGISPGIEEAIDKQNKKQHKKFFYKKIIIIDKNIPPITIIDQEKIPKTKCQKFKAISYKFLYILAGMVISIFPQIIEWATRSDDITCTPAPTEDLSQRDLSQRDLSQPFSNLII